MRLAPTFVLACLLNLPTVAAAAEFPEDGWWWNPQASGRGYQIERQGNTMFISSVHYANNGRPEWLTLIGNYTPSTTTTTSIGSFSGQSYQTLNGQCLGCVYVAPAVSNSTQGVATITFTTNQTAVLNWQGETVPIQRQFWGFSNTLGQLTGDWALSRVENGSTTTQLVKIASSGTSNTVSNLSTGAAVGTITASGSTLNLNLTTGSLVLPIKMPETNRFYAGAGATTAAQIVATRVNDVPLATTSATTPTTTTSAFSEFGRNVSVVFNQAAGTVTLEAAGRPDHTSPYWDPNGTSGLYVAAGPETTVTRMSPGFIDNYTNRYFLTVPINPQKAATPTATGLGAIGIAISGAPIFNDLEGPNVPLASGVISGFDNYGAHTGPQVYHYHLEPTPISNDDTKLIAILRDGFFLYGRKCVSVTTGTGHPTDLDTSGGHTHVTQHSTTPVYHYHIKNQIYQTVNNKNAYLLFDEAYQGTPNPITTN